MKQSIKKGTALILSMLLLLTSLTPAFAESAEHYDTVTGYPRLADVQQQLNANEAVIPDEITIHSDDDFDPEDTSRMTGFDHASVNIHLYKNALSAEFKARIPGSYTLYYVVHPTSGHPAYETSRKVHVLESAVVNSTEGGADDSATEQTPDQTDDDTEDDPHEEKDEMDTVQSEERLDEEQPAEYSADTSEPVLYESDNVESEDTPTDVSPEGPAAESDGQTEQAVKNDDGTAVQPAEESATEKVASDNSEAMAAEDETSIPIEEGSVDEAGNESSDEPMPHDESSVDANDLTEHPADENILNPLPTEGSEEKDEEAAESELPSDDSAGTDELTEAASGENTDLSISDEHNDGSSSESSSPEALEESSIEDNVPTEETTPTVEETVDYAVEIVEDTSTGDIVMSAAAMTADEPVFSAMSAESPDSGEQGMSVVLDRGTQVDYPADLGDWATTGYRVDGKVAYCLEAKKDGPKNGTYMAEVLASNPSLAKALYYGYGGPGDLSGDFYAEYDDDVRYVMTHIAACYFYTGDFETATVGCWRRGKEKYRIQEYIDYLDALPDPPSPSIRLTNDALTIKTVEDGSQVTTSTTLDADSRNGITLTLPDNVTYHNQDTGATQTGGTVYIAGGTTFFFSAPSSESGVWFSEQLNGLIDHVWQVIVFSTGEKSQDIGSYMTETYGDSVQFSVAWKNELRLTLIKADASNPNLQLSGAVIGIYSDEACTNLIATMTTGDDGTASCSLTRDFACVYLKELTAPAGYRLNKTVYTVDVPDEDSITAMIKDEKQEAGLKITKMGEALTGATPTDNGLVFTYESRRLSGAVYRVIANDSIYNMDGALLYQKGDVVVENLITDENGEVFISGIPLGSYLIEETQAPQGYLLSSEKHEVTLDYAGQEAEVAYDETTFVNDRQKADVSIVKQDGESAVPLAGAVFGLYNDTAIYSMSGSLLAAADTLIERVTSGADGSAAFTADLPIGHSYTVREIQAPSGYSLTNDTYSFTFSAVDQATPVVTFSHTFTDNTLMTGFKFVKVDAETGMPQGDAKLSGAVYGLYARDAIAHPDGSTGALYEKDALVLTMTTDADGYASADNLYPGRYYLKEITPSEGYMLDTAEYDIDFTPTGIDDQLGAVCTVSEQVMKQPFQIIKAANNGKTDADLIEGAGFSAWLLSDVSSGNGGYDLSRAQPVVLGSNGATEIFTDRRGYAVSVPLPYGTYLVRETTTPENYSPVDDFIVTISENLPDTPQVWRVLLDEEYAARLKIIKIDADTGRAILVPGAEFAVYDLDRQEYITQMVSYPQHVRLNTFKTDESGTLVMPEKLRPGHYRVEEVSAPEGYLLGGMTAEVTISAASVSQTDPLTAEPIFTVTFKDQAVRGRISVYKEGEMLSDYENGQFVYTTQRLAGASFDVIAAEDIYTADRQRDENGNPYLEYAEGTVVATLTTDVNGEAQTSDLPLGRYNVVEKQTPDGFVLDSQPHPVTLSYADQETAIVTNSVTVTNERQKVKVLVEKKAAGKDIRLPGAVFALYAGENITANGRVLVEAGTCLKTAETDENGSAAFDIDLPLGSYYLNEIQAPAGYVRSDEVATVDASYHGPQTAEITVHCAIEDTPTRVSISKADATTGVELDGALLTLRDADGNVVDTWTSVAGEPHIIEGLVIGQTYTLEEKIAPHGYLLTSAIQFTVQDTAQMQKVVMKDEVPTGNLIINKSGEFLSSVSTLESVGGVITSSFSYLFDGLGDVSFNVYAMDDIKHADGATRDYYKAGDLIATITTDATGIAMLENLPLGRYRVREAETPNGYVLDGKDRVIDLSYRDAVTPIVTYSEEWQNERQRISLKITKKDAETSEALSGAVFGLFTGEHIFSQNGSIMLLPDTLIAQQATDSTGALTFDVDLPVGYAYYVEELTPPDGYATNSEVWRFTFDGTSRDATATFEHTFADQPTLIDVTKSSLTTSEEIVGAILQVTDERGTVIDKWTSGEAPHRITRLVVGKSYTLTEIMPADGYVTAESITFTIADTGEAQTVEMKDDVTKVKISKVDIAGEELEGASLTLLHEDGRIIDSWISGTEPHYIEKLPVGHYTLREESAPEGYLMAEEVTFEVLETGEIQTVTMTDEHTTLRVLKTDEMDNALEGASMTLLNDAGIAVDSWISDKEPHVVDHLSPGFYTLREENAPAGYLLADEITFELLAVSEVQTISMTDEYTRLLIAKTDVDGNTLEGAALSLLDDAGNVVDSWVSGMEPHYIEHLPAGAYSLREDSAPEGYLLAEAIAFDLLPTSDVQTISMADDYTRVLIAKTDAEDNTLEGASLALLNEDGLIIDSWISGSEPHYVEKLPIGHYILREESAPEGYLLAEEVAFEVQDTAEIQTVAMTDEYTRLRIAKTDAEGNPLEGASLVLINDAGRIVDNWISGTEPHIVEHLPAGVYTLHEERAPEGFVPAEDIAFELLGVSEVQIVAMTDDYTRLLIAKTDVDGVVLEGATLTLLDSADNIVDSWVSGTEPHYIEHLSAGIYTLREENAPAGYLLAEPIIFDLLPVSEVQTICMEDDYTRLLIAKSDAEGAILEGASLALLNEKGQIVDSWISGTEPHYVEKLPVGHYVLREESAPEGYLMAEEIAFELVETSEVQTIAMTDEYTRLLITKADMDGNTLKGASLALLNSTGNVVDSWVSGLEPHIIEHLPAGIYTLREQTAPDGYLPAEDITFELLAVGKVQTISMSDDHTRLLIVKNDSDGNTLAGASLSLLDDMGNIVDSWVSGPEPHYIERLPVGIYTLREDSAPEGYLMAEDIVFELAETNEVQTIVMMDDHTRLLISKTDTEGNMLEGASLTLLNDSGNIVDSWVSGSEPHFIEHLPAGIYTLREDSAPEGYLTAEDMTFELLGIGEAQSITMTDEYTRLLIAKTDEAGNTLEGASLTLLNEAGTVVDSWISGAEPHYIEHLPAGTYTLREDSAPDGYLIADPITFEIKAVSSVQTLTMVNEVCPDTPTTPKTGDDEHPMIWVCVGVIALMGIVLSAITMKKRRPRR